MESTSFADSRPTTTEVAKRYIDALEVQMESIVERHARSGLGGIFGHIQVFDPKDLGVPPPKLRDPREVTASAVSRWRGTLLLAARMYPTRLPEPHMIGGAIIFDLVRTENQLTNSYRLDEKDWQRRLEDDCELLAILQDEVTREPEPDLPELTASAKKCADYIRKNKGQTGENIAHGIRPTISPGYFFSEIVPKLEAHGFWNKRGRDGGYFPPEANGETISP